MNLRYRVLFWFLLATVLISSGILVSKVFGADSAESLSRGYNRVFAELLVKKIGTLYKGELIRLNLKTGKTVVGTFEGYVEYDDSLFILPLGKYGLFADEAYSSTDLEDVNPLLKHK